MKGLFAFCLVFLVVIVTRAQKKPAKNMVCTAVNTLRQKCNPAKAGGWCLPRVKGVTYDQYQVKPTYFLVTWKPISTAKCYHVQVLKEHTSFVLKTFACVKAAQFTVTGLKPWTVYGVRVSAVNRRCKRGPPSRPVLRIKTFWSPDAVVTKPTPRPTYSPKVGACGKKFFTCTSKNKKECIPERKYCNEVLDCTDGSDERGCLGGCKEIDVNFKNGNYSCSRWGSPGSFCFFDCKDGYFRDGSRYTQCSRKEETWTNPLPICRLYRTRIFKVLQEEETSPTEVAVEWESVDHAVQYAVQAVQQGADEGDEDFTVNKEVNATACCTSVINGLKPRVEYRISMFAVDADGLRGEESLPVFYRPGMPKVVFKSQGA